MSLRCSFFAVGPFLELVPPLPKAEAVESKLGRAIGAFDKSLLEHLANSGAIFGQAFSVSIPRLIFVLPLRNKKVLAWVCDLRSPVLIFFSFFFSSISYFLTYLVGNIFLLWRKGPRWPHEAPPALNFIVPLDKVHFAQLIQSHINGL